MGPFSGRRWRGALTRVGALSVVLAAGLAGCHPARGVQDVAWGKGVEVPSAELNQSMSHLPPIPPDQVVPVRNRVLSGLIDQKLFAQQALKEKLQREPAVMQAIEAARREILARSYAERVVNSLPPPSDKDVAQFYQAHPELFAHRNLVLLNEIEVNGAPDALKALKAAFDRGGGSLEAFQAFLKANGHPVQIVHVARAPETLPTSVAEAFTRLKPGQPIVYGLPSGYSFAVVDQMQPAPLTEEQSVKPITAMLTNSGREDLLKKEVGRLRSQAQIQYAKGYAPLPQTH